MTAQSPTPSPSPADCADWDAVRARLTAAAERAAAAPLAQQLEIRTPSLEQAVGNLSGGNQQKVSLAKWLAANVDILIVDEPTVGIDIKTKSPMKVKLADHDVKPRDNFGKIATKAFDLLGTKVADVANVSLELRATPAP